MDYKIIYSKRRTISITVKNGQIVVRAPFYTSKSVIANVVAAHKLWIEKALEKEQAKNDRITSLTDLDIENLKKKSKQIIPDKVEKYSKIMNLKYSRVKITDAKTRFGSCSSKGNLCFSCFLMLYPEEAIDYVVVHELAHIKEMNHSAAFYKIIEAVLPDYKERVKLLKK